MGTKLSTSTNLHQHNCKPLISQCSLIPVFMWEIFTACMLTGVMVPTVGMDSVWLVMGKYLAALLSFQTQRFLPACTLVAGTVVLTPILHLLVLTRTTAYPTGMFSFCTNLHTFFCTNQQPPQRGGAVPGPVWVGSKWLLAFPRVPVTPGTPHSFFRYAAP